MRNLWTSPFPPKTADDPLYPVATEVERDELLTAEMAEWEEATLADGLDDGEYPGKPVS